MGRLPKIEIVASLRFRHSFQVRHAPENPVEGLRVWGKPGASERVLEVNGARRLDNLARG